MKIKRKRIATSIAAMALMVPLASLHAKQKIINFPIYRLDAERFVLKKMLGELPDGGIIVLDYTSIDCKPCRKEIPELVSLTEPKGGRVKLLFVYFEYDKNKVGTHADSFGIRERAYTDLFNAIKKDLGISGIPYTIIVDKDGYVLGRFSGYNEKNINSIKSILSGVR